ncbi:MAG: M23 family metallopeptidase [Hyphomonadaceae bacterium]
MKTRLALDQIKRRRGDNGRRAHAYVAKKRKPAKAMREAPRTFAERVKAILHMGSAGLSVVMCVMFTAAAFASMRHEAVRTRAPAAPLVLTASTLDLDFDGVADVGSPAAGFVRQRDRYGAGAFGAARDGGRRRHMGVDYVAAPGDIAHAPLSGQVTRIGPAYNARSGLNFIEINDPDLNLRARIFYVAPSVSIGDQVTAGDPIGAAQDLSVRYPAGITNHVHVEVLNAQGARIDPTALLPPPAYVQQQAGRGTFAVRR